MISEEKHDLMIRESLAAWRVEAGYTQQQIADFLNISRRNVQQIECGEVRVKSYTVIKWAEITGHDAVLLLLTLLHPELSLSESLQKKKKFLSDSLELCSENEIDALIEIKRSIDSHFINYNL